MLGLTIALAAAGLIRVAWGGGELMERVSVANDDAEGDGASLSAAVSADGRFVAFASDGSNLVPDDTNGVRDIFVRDLLAGTTERVSIASHGGQANRFALFPAISADGRFVVFSSDADNLVPDDTNGASDVFVHDRQTAVTERVSVAANGAQGNDDSLTPSISADGRYVTYTSLANNLVGDDTNNDRDVFVYDRQTGAVERASVASDGTQGDFASGGLGAGPARVSGDGRFVVFGSFARNLVPDDTNGYDDIFARDRETGVTERVSVASDDAEGNGHSMYPGISDDGRYVVFASAANSLTVGDANGAIDIFLRDRQAGTTVRLSEAPSGAGGNGTSHFPVISADGRVVAFQSGATDLAPSDTNGVTDIFRSDLESGALERVSVSADGSEGGGASTFVAISGDGRVVAFQSDATNLVPGDTNGMTDVFARGPAAPSPAPTGDVNCDGSTNAIDAALILQLDAGLSDTLACPDAADVNEDGASNAVDATLILQFDAGLLESLRL